MKLTINSYQAVAEWKWNLPEGHDNVCGICRVDFEGTCSKCKYPGDDCPILIGACTHCFHLHCIADWLGSEASQGRCPMCRQVFREKAASTPAAGNNGGGGGGGGGNPRTPSSVASGSAQQQVGAHRNDRGGSSDSSRTR
ncbi:Anaphase-promoting complex subunit 11 [Lecanosticta acicola]|uniref:Anaphase-promoting complex subunit 11 n=1 Tax=Lecanosticta acicola TaxID=111012 RepID=A0AAI9EEC9_9PEZI|nr:Anaphase-promoting complex subunit 11 [Lecanosticta acicola]